ncbi:nitrous oxide reductase accessory protein NosL [Campylobacter sp. 9BO]|uniref:nitrous oxide reductase accessory protein NosL n=1 Tax=Campylobacter sp. 9BO TaxID=3424759 RepID=UPI003D34C641
MKFGLFLVFFASLLYAQDLPQDVANMEQIYKKGEQFYKQNCPRVSKRGIQNIEALKEKLAKICKNQDEQSINAAALYIWDAPKTIAQKLQKIEVPTDARCPICGMLVAKNPNWAAMIEDGSQNLYFDGVKDLMKYYFKNGKKFERVFVSDYYKLHKIDAKTAFFVIGSNIYGPMGDELVPFEKESDAINFAKDHFGKAVLKFSDISEQMLTGL